MGKKMSTIQNGLKVISPVFKRLSGYMGTYDHYGCMLGIKIKISCQNLLPFPRKNTSYLNNIHIKYINILRRQ